MNDRKDIFSSRRQQLIPHDDWKTILIDYYTGAYGPTLRVDIKGIDGLVRLNDLFVKLANSGLQNANIQQIGRVKFSGFESIEMTLWPHRKEPRKLVELVQAGDGGLAFHWTRHSEGWKEWAEMVDALKRPGHQYLTGKDQDDAIIEISFMEDPAPSP